MADSPQLESIEQVSDGWIKKYVLTYRMPDGSLHPYEVASRKNLHDFEDLLRANSEGTAPRSADAVCIVAITPRGTVLMIREFRYPLNSWCIAFPAGLIDPGEDMATCLDRELSEETGYCMLPESTVKFLPQAGYSSTGMSDEAVQIAFVEADKVTNAHTEPNELIEVFELPLNEIEAFLHANKEPIGTRAQLVLYFLAERYKNS